MTLKTIKLPESFDDDACAVVKAIVALLDGVISKQGKRYGTGNQINGSMSKRVADLVTNHGGEWTATKVATRLRCSIQSARRGLGTACNVGVISRVRYGVYSPPTK